MDLVSQKLFPKRYPVISPSLMKPECGDPLKFEFNPVFYLGFPEFTDPDYECYATLWDRISDLDVLLTTICISQSNHRLSNSSTVHMLRRRRLQLPL